MSDQYTKSGNSGFLRLSSWLGVLAFASVVGYGVTANADTFRANLKADLPDDNPGDGICRAIQTTDQKRLFNCSLRAAVMEANALPGADKIILNRGKYKLTLAGYSTETGAFSGDLDVVDKLQLVGKGKDLTTVDASALGDRIFDLHGPGVVTIEGMTLTGGTAMGPARGANDFPTDDPNANEVVCPIVKPADGADGGAILNRGDIVQIRDVRFEDNIALCDGGAVENVDDGVMLLVECDFSYNTAIANGGAVENDEDSIMSIKTGTFHWNNAQENGGALSSDDSITLIDDSKMRFNAARENGGAIWNGDSDAMRVKTSIIRYNDATDGGGIFNNDGFLLLRENEIDRNSPNDIVDEQIDEGLPTEPAAR